MPLNKERQRKRSHSTLLLWSKPRNSCSHSSWSNRMFSHLPLSSPLFSYLYPISRIDTCWQVNYNWGGGGPAALNGQTDHFSVAWSGLVQPRFSGAYTFYAAYAPLLLLLLFYLQLLLFIVIVDLMTEHACGWMDRMWWMRGSTRGSASTRGSSTSSEAVTTLSSTRYTLSLLLLLLL